MFGWWDELGNVAHRFMPQFWLAQPFGELPAQEPADLPRLRAWHLCSSALQASVVVPKWP